VGVILLVRHGQASWGAADYDRLSPLGEQQGEALGSWLVEAGVRPTRLVGGSLRRHRQTADAVLSATAGAGWDLDDMVADPGWDEYDHVQLLDAYGVDRGVPEAPSGRAELDAWFDAAVERWVSGAHDADYPVSFPDFTERVDGALRRTVTAAGPGETVVVLTSGGPIAWALTSLLDAATPTWQRLNPVLLNTSVSKLTVGRRGATAVSFNEHGHLPAELLTYR
jgi:broad specificity phosphatase PhoE